MSSHGNGNNLSSSIHAVGSSSNHSCSNGSPPKGISRQQGRIGPNIMFLGVCMIFLSLVKIYQAQHCTFPSHHPPQIIYDLPSSHQRSHHSSSTYNNNPHRSATNGIDNDSIPSGDDTPPTSLEEDDPPLPDPDAPAAESVLPPPSADDPSNADADADADISTVTISKAAQPQQRVVLKQRKKTIPTERTQVDMKVAKCTLVTPPKHAKTLARIIVLQRDGRHQLRDFVNHYTRVLPYDSLVLMDHEGTDEYTRALLQEYGKLGANVWSCKGPFKAKHLMWTYVTRIYGKDSGFVFPVDIDELLAVHVGKELQWNIPVFRNALHKLGRAGKPYKMNWIESVPAECHVYMDTSTNTIIREEDDDESTQQQQSTDEDTAIVPSSSFASEMCDIRYVKIKDQVGCMDKTFARGYQFYKTDTGNHYGGTIRYPKLNLTVCETKGFDNIYDVSDLALIHLKEKTFEDWLVHGLRGATDRGFHTDFNIDCDQVSQSIHYCRKWEKITKANFSPYLLRKIFVQDVCPPPDTKLMAAHKVFCDG